MITKWKVFNFKSIRQETELEMAPLTLFAGVNSSGKSTLIQSILLIAQTISHKIGTRSVVLNGSLVRLGQFDDLKSEGSGADQITIGWSCKADMVAPSIPRMAARRRYYHGSSGPTELTVSCELSFDAISSDADKEIVQLQPKVYSTEIAAVIDDATRSIATSRFAARRSVSARGDIHSWLNAIPTRDSAVRESLSYEVQIDDATLAEIQEEVLSATPIGCILRHFLPDRLAIGFDWKLEDARALASVLTGLGRRAPLSRYTRGRDIVIPEGLLDAILQAAPGMKESMFRDRDAQPDLFGKRTITLERFEDALRRLNPQLRFKLREAFQDDTDLEVRIRQFLDTEGKFEPAVVLYRVPSALSESIEYLDQFFSASVRYLGPLRDEPKSLYPLAPTADPYDVGLKGEHTAAVLDTHKNRRIEYLPSSCFQEAKVSLQPVHRTLETAVTDWMRYLGVAESVQSIDRGKLGHELKVRISPDRKSAEDLTHVGVGVSQVLPILVACLLADRDTTLLFEQPELHLHPRVQTLLGDFFLSMTQLGKQCVVETHSEYLVNRIRFRTAAADSPNPWLPATKVYFVDRTENGSSFREVCINKYGAILDWPEGFFDQTPHESAEILRAAMSKKRRERETHDDPST